jgi:hypothetical protein
VKFYFLLLITCFFFRTLEADPEFTPQRADVAVAQWLSHMHESAGSVPFNISCSNVYEWMLACKIKNINVRCSLCGLSNDDMMSFLYDSEHLFYRPEVKNNAIDIKGKSKWEIRLSISLSLENLILKK